MLNLDEQICHKDTPTDFTVNVKIKDGVAYTDLKPEDINAELVAGAWKVITQSE